MNVITWLIDKYMSDFRLVTVDITAVDFLNDRQIFYSNKEISLLNIEPC